MEPLIFQLYVSKGKLLYSILTKIVIFFLMVKEEWLQYMGNQSSGSGRTKHKKIKAYWKLFLMSKSNDFKLRKTTSYHTQKSIPDSVQT